jgi:nitroreductase
MNTSQIDPIKIRKVDFLVEPIFVKRWSARAMSGEPITQDTLMRLFEAARWAPSAANRQEWHFLYAHRETAVFHTYLDLLDDGNRLWCQRASVLLVVLARCQREDGRPIKTCAFDTGMAFENLALQGTSMQLVVHPMAGFDYDKTREVLHVPPEYAVQCMVAVGCPGEISDLPQYQQEREIPSQRKFVKEFIQEGFFNSTSEV